MKTKKVMTVGIVVVMAIMLLLITVCSPITEIRYIYETLPETTDDTEVVIEDETPDRITYIADISYAGATLQIPESVIIEYAGDEDGAEIRIALQDWSTTNSEILSRHFLFYYNPENGKWRTSLDVSGINNNGTTQHVFNLVDTAYFTDGYYSGSTNLGDNTTDFGLLLWNAYTGPTRSARLTIID